MSLTSDSRIKKRLRQGEGYLELGMAGHALEAMQGIEHGGEYEFTLQLLRGLAYRELKDYARGVEFLERAAGVNPNSVTLQMALAWCYKRTDRLALAISATEFAHHLDPQEPILMYNLACYHSLAGEKEQALSWLGQALRVDSGILKLIPEETDFDPLRHDPDFVRMLELAQPPPV